VLFERRLKEGIHDGTIVLAFRRWNRCQVIAGRRYRTGMDLVEVETVDVINSGDIDATQAAEAGYGTVYELLVALGDTAVPLYRIRFRRVEEPDPRDVLAGNGAMSGDELAKLTARLARMDAADSRGPWTTAILTQIADYPGTVSTVLAEELGWPQPDFKQHVRRLKELGLTISLDIGYRLSPRGEAYLNQVRSASSGASSSA
jgi:hypothetical protein